MKIDMQFQVTAMCKMIKDHKLTSEERKITLDLDLISAPKFLFKFGSNIFTIEDQDGLEYTVVFQYNKVYGNFTGITFVNNSNKELWYVSNANQLLSDISHGYYKSRTLEKFGTLLDFDFEMLEDNSELVGEEIPDEFEE